MALASLFPFLSPNLTHPASRQVRATFHSLTSYKNGMKGVVATQIGNVRFVNFTLADNGGGPRSHAGVSGKDNGAGGEIT